MRKPKDGELLAMWARLPHGETPPEGDLCYDGPSRSDMRLLSYALSREDYRSYDQTFGPSFLAELEARGYDLTTLKFSIRKKASADGAES